MPIFEFKCPKCNTIYEEIVYNTKIHQPPICLKCKTITEKIFSRFGFNDYQLKWNREEYE